MIDQSEFIALSAIEQLAVDGGQIPAPVINFMVGAALLVVGEVIKNWGDFVGGVSSGYNSSLW